MLTLPPTQSFSWVLTTSMLECVLGILQHVLTSRIITQQCVSASTNEDRQQMYAS